MTQQATDLTVRRTVTVEAPQERAFAVFSDEIGAWWPLPSKSIGTSEAQTAVVESRAGGRWFERGADGSECDWGRVLTYEPPARLVLSWQISADWRYDPTIDTEVEVRFIAEGESRTRVELEHRGLEAYREHAAQMHATFDSADGWGDILDRYRAVTGS